MQTVEVLYSPVCEASIAFVGLLTEWLAGTAVCVHAHAFDPAAAGQRALLAGAGLLEEDRLTETCFVEVFCEGRRIDSVPLRKERVFAALGLPLPPDDRTGPLAPPPLNPLPLAALPEGIGWLPLTRDTLADELQMCLCNYPHGNPPARFHAACREAKRQVFEAVWPLEICAGVYAVREGQVVGLLEVLPREILRRHGFQTGLRGADQDVLTVGCYEVGCGMPRVAMLDELMRQLLLRAHLFRRPLLEGIGVYAWPDGFTPFWVYDKYGFRLQARLTDRKVIMERVLADD